MSTIATSGNQRVFDYDFTQIVFTSANVLTPSNPDFAQSSGGTAGTGNAYAFSFGVGTQFKDNQIAFQEMILYYSWFNISAANGNNTFSYNWPMVNGGPTQFTITLPDGYYSVDDINLNIQTAMISNLHYLNSPSQGTFVYLLEIQSNGTYYRNQITSWDFPTIAAARTYTGLSDLQYANSPSNTWAFENASNANPSITIPVQSNVVNSNTPLIWQSRYFNTLTFASFLGFDPTVNPYNGTFPQTGTKNQAPINISSNSSPDPTFTPEAEPIQVVTINITQSKNVLSTNQSQAVGFFSASGTSFGFPILVQADPEFAWFDLQDGSFPQMTLVLLDQNFRPIVLQDPVTFATFLIRKRPDRQGPQKSLVDAITKAVVEGIRAVFGAHLPAAGVPLSPSLGGQVVFGRKRLPPPHNFGDQGSDKRLRYFNANDRM